MPEVWEQEGHVRAGACLRGDLEEELNATQKETTPLRAVSGIR